ncbi:uncharacterized protein LOC126880304 [Diabrotica virgifera virgifera]|uniref:CHK kinase-like domain-containing protein n=1 Tax=Diabrotica virgifera virgifera TaxID=50390 RepID=A0ABM5JQ47_DIAVI|nr:uncharacterized protein LOC126880304 [Diabrotica virgifera virgifera]
MELCSEQKVILEKVAKENGFKNYTIKSERASNTGDNFVGVLNRISIEENARKIAVIIKSTKSGVEKEIQNPRIPFLREIYVYDQIFPTYAKFAKEFNIKDVFKAHCKCFGTCDEENKEYLVLEDMREHGFKMCSKYETMNSFHVEAVIREYAKFHSLALAMNTKRPEQFIKLTKGIFKDVPQQHRADVQKIQMLNLYNAVKGDQLATDVVKKFENQLNEAIATDTNDYVVIIHGDTWCNNMLFKYEDINNQEKPAEVCIIDWQISQLGSPANDLVNFLFYNGSEKILDDYEKYLKIYYETLRNNLKEFSCDAEEILPFERLRKMFKNYCGCSLWNCVLIMRLQMCEHEVPDIKNIKSLMENGATMEDLVNFKIRRIDEYYRRLGVIIKFMIKNSLFK